MVNDLARLGGLLADPTRSEILLALMDGRARTGSELARYVGVAPSTASEHLGKLLDGSMVKVEAQGRHRYWRLFDRRVAALIESMGATTSALGPPLPKVSMALARARTCYDHLAGRLAVTVFEGLLADRHLHEADGRLGLAPSGVELFTNLGVDVSSICSGSRPPFRPCLDWTERTHHLAGAGGRALFEVFRENGWIVHGRQPRTIGITDAGGRAFRKHFGWES